MSKKRRDQQHVRLYASEIQSEAYRSLSVYARALLIEFRALYTGKKNCVYLSLREAQKRLGVGQRPAQRAIAELLDRGFIRLLNQPSRRAGLAAEYALTNEPMEGANVAPMDFMRWRSPGKSAVKTTADRSQNSCGSPLPDPENTPYRSQNECALVGSRRKTAVKSTTQIGYQASAGSGGPVEIVSGNGDAVLGGSMACPCGEQTSNAKERRGSSVLHYQRCGGCGRCDRFVLKKGPEVLAVGSEARQRFLANGSAA